MENKYTYYKPKNSEMMASEKYTKTIYFDEEIKECAICLGDKVIARLDNIEYCELICRLLNENEESKNQTKIDKDCKQRRYYFLFRK